MITKVAHVLLLSASLLSYSYAVTLREANQIYDRILKANNYKTYKLIRIMYGRDLGVNAYARPDGSIFVTKDLLKTRNKQEMAYVIAHELGHLTGASMSEVKADILGKQYANRAGYNQCKARYHYKDLFYRYGPGKPFGRHPDNRARFDYLSTGCKKDDPRLWRL